MIVYNDAQNIQKLLEGCIHIPRPLVWIIKSKVSSRAKTQGIGLHSREEVQKLTEEQLSAISAYLGTIKNDNDILLLHLPKC